MSQRRNRLAAAPLIAVLGLVAFAGPAGASGESVGGCMAEHLAEAVEENHGDLQETLHDEEVQKDLEKCFEAPNPILPETNEIIWGALSFGLLFFFMAKKGFPAVKGAMDARAERIASDLDAAEQAKIDARAVEADYQARLGDAKGEASRLIDEARGAADQLKADLSARAEKKKKGEKIRRRRK